MPSFRVTYMSFEDNERWTVYDMEEGSSAHDVEARIASESHTCGDEICTILSIEEI